MIYQVVHFWCKLVVHFWWLVTMVKLSEILSLSRSSFPFFPCQAQRRRSETLRRRWAWICVEKMEDGECWKVYCAMDNEHLTRLKLKVNKGTTLVNKFKPYILWYQIEFFFNFFKRIFFSLYFLSTCFFTNNREFNIMESVFINRCWCLFVIIVWWFRFIICICTCIVRIFLIYFRTIFIIRLLIGIVFRSSFI